jgi:hypothetical protein
MASPGATPFADPWHPGRLRVLQLAFLYPVEHSVRTLVSLGHNPSAWKIPGKIDSSEKIVGSFGLGEFPK